MGRAAAWALAAVIAGAGCGGSASRAVVRTPDGPDEHAGPDAACRVCQVTGGGRIRIGDQPVQFAVEVVPDPEGTGSGGQGLAASGRLRFQAVPASFGGIDVAGRIDTLLGCAREGNVLVATFSGTIEGDGRFTGVALDRGEPAEDTLAFPDPDAIPSLPIAAGDLHVHDLDGCAPR